MKEFGFKSEADAAEKMTPITIQEFSQLVWSVSLPGLIQMGLKLRQTLLFRHVTMRMKMVQRQIGQI